MRKSLPEGARTAALLLLLAAGLAARAGAEETASRVFRSTVELFPQLDFQRSLGQDLYFRGIYDLLAWDHYRATVGLSLSVTPPSVDGYFLDLGVDDILGTGLGAHVKFMGDQYPEYGRAADTLMPYAVWRWAFLDLGFGVTWRFLVVEPAPIWCMFWYDPYVVEAIFSFKIGTVWDFFDGFWTLSVSLSNQDEFSAGNFGSFTVLFGNSLAFAGNWSGFFDFLYRPAGTMALTADNSIFVFRMGGRISL